MYKRTPNNYELLFIFENYVSNPYNIKVTFSFLIEDLLLMKVLQLVLKVVAYNL